MLKKTSIGFVYISIAIIFIYFFSGYFIIEEAPSEYERNISKLKYQLGFEDIYCYTNSPNTLSEANALSSGKEKTVYLTFDDGPSARTEEILDLLDAYDIKATFFIDND